MAIFHYKDGSLLDQVQILTNEAGGLRAYLHARNEAGSESLRMAKLGLRHIGYECVPTVVEGRPVLEVRGFTKAEDFLKDIGGLGLTHGAASVEADANDRRNLGTKAKSNTLKMAGLSYNIGDVSYLWYATAPVVQGWGKATRTGKFFGVLDVIAGIGYGLGSLPLTFFGSKDQSINAIKTATSKIERFARKEGYEVPTESSIAYVNKEPDRGFFGNVKAFVSRFPSEVTNSIFLGVGLCITAASLYKGTRPLSPLLNATERLEARQDQRDKLIDVGLGVVTASSALIGITVKETKPVEGDPKHTGFGRVIDWVKEKPLRATGIGYGIATAWHGLSTVNLWRHGKEPKKFLIGRVIFIVTNVFSEAMLFLSSKGHGTGVKPDASIDDSVMATAAELILRQPKEKRDAVTSQLAGYMASPEVLGGKAEEIEKNLRVHLDLLDNNPWTKHFVGHEDAQTKAAISSEPVPTAAPGTKVAGVQHAAMLVDPAAQSVAVH